MVARPKVIVQQNNKKLIISSESLNIQRRHCVVRNAMHCCAFADAFYCISGVVKCILAGDRVSAQRQSRRTVTLFVTGTLTAEIKRVNCPNILLFLKQIKSLPTGGTMLKCKHSFSCIIWFSTLPPTPH